MASQKRRWLSGAFNRVAPPPPAPQDNIVELFHGTAVADPFRPLEALDDARTVAWVAAQNERFERFVADVAARAPIAASLHDLMDYPESRIPEQAGLREFRWVRAGVESGWCYEVKDSPLEGWRMLLDPRTMGEGGPAAIEDAEPSPDSRYVAYSFAENGSDELTMRVRDVESGMDLQDELTGVRFTRPRWEPESEGYTYTGPSPRKSGHLACMFHALDTDHAEDQHIFTAPDRLFPSYFALGGRGWIRVTRGTLPDNGLWILGRDDDEEPREIFKPGIATHKLITRHGGLFYMLTDHRAPHGKLVAFDLTKPQSRCWKTVIPESDSETIRRVIRHDDQLLLVMTKGGTDRLVAHDMNGKKLHEAPLPSHSELSVTSGGGSHHMVLVKVTGPKESSSIYGYDPQRNTVRRVRDSQAPGDLQNCIVETLHAPSPDGTMVPIQLIRHPDTKRDGTAALMLHVYGGFNEIETLGYSSFMAQWVRMGGIYAVAQVRGGGEMGRDWYDQGRLLKKQNTFDDLAACARHLIDKKYTSAARLVSEGGSNGGMVTLATMLQKPRLFGAVLADVPVTDMMRYQHFTAGKGWRSDYGDPETKRADFQATMGYSPLHNVRRGAVYPPCLVMTGDHDDRVVPSHAYKFVAALQQHAHRDNIALLRVGQDTGHGAGKPLALEIAEYADIFAFVTRSIGPINQAEFKAARTVRQSPAPGAKPATWS